MISMLAPRPYYHDFAWAYDLLQTEAVAPRVEFIASLLRRHDVDAGAAILDAGCGTGRYAFELARRGYRVTGVDRSADLVAVARAREPEAGDRPELVVADLLDASFPRPFDAVLCRGVLNDFVEEADRRRVFARFALWLRPGGVLVFDVRDWARTAARYAGHTTNRKSVALPDGLLEFRSETVLDPATRRLRLREWFDLERGGARTSTANDFVMGCWTPDEIADHLAVAGLEEIAVYSTYGERARDLEEPAGTLPAPGAEGRPDTSDQAWSDRLVVVARRRAAAPVPVVSSR